MGFKGSLKPQRSNQEVIDTIAVFDIGADGAHTRVHGGGMSVARTAAGKYTITFTEWGPVLVDMTITVWRQTDAESLVARPTDGSFSATATSASAKFEIWEIDESAAQVDPASGDRVTIRAVFLKTT
jgi:hypothetical protein